MAASRFREPSPHLPAAQHEGEKCASAADVATYVRDPEQSPQSYQRRYNKIIIRLHDVDRPPLQASLVEAPGQSGNEAGRHSRPVGARPAGIIHYAEGDR